MSGTMLRAGNAGVKADEIRALEEVIIQRRRHVSIN